MSNLTKSYIEKLSAPCPFEQKFDWDNSIKGFGVRLTSGSKTFILDRKFNGRTVRMSIGRFPDWSVHDARDRARELIVMMDKGIDPRQEIKKKVEEGVTLAILFEQFIAERPLKERTQADYRRYLNFYFSNWKDRAITRIDGEMISKRYKEIAASSSGPAQASSAMRFLRAVLNFARATYGTTILPENPVATLTAKRAWIRDNARTDHLKNHEIKSFVEALRALPNSVMGAYLEFVLLTGARRSEAAKLRWCDVDFKSRSVIFRQTKNHTDRTVPITPRLNELLNNMLEWRLGNYVFSSVDKDDKPSHIVEPRKALRIANQAAGSLVTVHGLRRTFATILESLDCPAYPLKSLLGHSMKGDVTATHYTQIGVERLRPWAEKYDTFLAGLIKGSPADNVVTLPSWQMLQNLGRK